MTRSALADSALTVHEGVASAPVGAVRARVSARRGALLCLTDHHGNKGFGETSPLPGHSPETLDDVAAALGGVHRWLPASALDDPRSIRLDERVRAMSGGPRFALETALFDLVGRRRGVALHALLSGRPAPAPVPVNAYVGAALDATLLDASEAALSLGIGTLKVKLSGVEALLDRELAALRRLRAQLAAPWRLRLDVNAGWSLAFAAARLDDLSPLAPEFVEQPAPVGTLRTLGRRAVAWALDESLSDPEDTRFALREGLRGGCSAVVIKPALHGLLRAYELGLSATSAGLGVVVTHLFDGPVALAAACELALALPAPIACGLDLHPGLAAWGAAEIPQRRARPEVTPSRAPGLGLDVAVMLGSR